MSKIVYRIKPAGGFRSEWYKSREGCEARVLEYWFSLVERAKRLGVLVRQGTTKDHGLYFLIRYASGEERVFKYIK